MEMKFEGTWILFWSDVFMFDDDMLLTLPNKVLALVN